MDFTVTEEQRLLADSVQRFVREQYTFAARANGISKETAAPSCGSGMCGMPGICGRN